MTDASDDATSTPSPSDAPSGAPGRLIAFLGAKGGVGCTLLAAHVAAALAAESSWCAVDFDFCKGDLAAVLDLPTERSVSLLLNPDTVPGPGVVEAALQPHASGVRALVQPYDLSALHHIEAGDAERLLRLLRARFEGLVADAGSRVDVATLTTALQADDIVLVTTPDVPSLRDAQRVLQLLAALRIPQGHVRLVVNRMRSGLVPADEIARQLRIEVTATVRDDPATCERLDHTGQLAFAEAPRSAFAADVKTLAASLRTDAEDGVGVPRARPRWPWSRA